MSLAVTIALAVVGGVASLALVARPAVAAKQKIVILGVEAIDTDGHTQAKTAAFAKLLTEGMRNQVTTGATSYDLALNSQKELTELKLLSDCLDESTGCMSAIGRELGADVLVFGHLEKKKGDYIVTVTSLNVGAKSPGPLNLSRAIPIEDATDDLMRNVGAELFGARPGVPPPPLPSPPSTTLLVQTNVSAGTLYVNGEAKSTISNGTATVKGLPEGSVDVAIDAPGYQRKSGKAMLHAGSVTPFQVDLEPEKKAPETNIAILPPPTGPLEPPPPQARPGHTARVLFWTSLVLTAGGVAAFTVTGLQVKSIEDEESTAIKAWGTGYATNGVMYPNDACAEAKADNYAPLTDICNRGSHMATVTNVLIGATAVTALASAYFLWKGYLSSPSPTKDEPTATRARGKRAPEATSVKVAPQVYKGGGGGFGAVIQF